MVLMSNLFALLVFIAFILVVALFSVALRAHGSATIDEVTGLPTGWPNWDKWAAKILLSLSMAGANYAMFNMWWIALLCAPLTFFGVATGHGRWFGMQGANLSDPNPEFIEKVFGWLYRGDISKPGYSWFCFGIKGVWITAPLGFPALAMAFLWPFSYYLSMKYESTTEYGEWLTGAFLGALLFITLGVV